MTNIGLFLKTVSQSTHLINIFLGAKEIVQDSASHNGSQQSVIVVPWYLMPFSRSVGMKHIHICRKNTYTQKIKINRHL